jgi:serine/threonine protein kinase
MTTKYQPGVRVSEYVLEQYLGGGTFGEVWQARHHIWEQERVAIKLPTEPEYVRFLQREGVVVHGLRHPNIIRVMGLDPYAEIPYLIMELVKGPSLREVLAEHQSGLPSATVVVVLRGLLQAMVAAHGANVIHRDLKPGNVLLHLDGRPLETLTVDQVKVGDFGLGVAQPDALRSIIEQSASIERDAQSATLSGTLAYMAPEVRDGEQSPGPRSDLYSIGVVLFEMLTGGRPAGTELPGAVRAGVPAALDEVFRRLYARYDNRYESAQAVLHDLDARLAPPRVGRRTTAVPPPPPPPPPPDVPQTCRRCDEPAAAGDQFCTSCGEQLVKTVRRCPSCAGYPGPRDSFCIFCGAALLASEE